MQQVILDTNALAMVLTDDQRLPEKAKQTILNAAMVSVSAISFYEVGQKVRLGKWPEMEPFAQDLVEIVRSDGFNLLSLTSQQAAHASLLEWSHRDPFDRLIAAVTLLEGALLVSSDMAFDQLEKLDRFWS